LSCGSGDGDKADDGTGEDGGHENKAIGLYNSRSPRAETILGYYCSLETRRPGTRRVHARDVMARSSHRRRQRRRTWLKLGPLRVSYREEQFRATRTACRWYISRLATTRKSNAPLLSALNLQVTTCYAAYDITVGWAYWLSCVQAFGQGVYATVDDGGCQCCPPSDNDSQWRPR
jgi:hypothetical protein